MNKALFLLLFFSSTVFASEVKPIKFMYGDIVTFEDDFYGICRGKVIRKDTFPTLMYVVDAKCKSDPQEDLQMYMDAGRLTLVKHKH